MLQWIKRLFNTEKYNSATVRMMAQQGRDGSHVQPFNYRKAVQLYRSWVYAAAHINATAVAASPLRLYIRSKSQTKSMWRTRSVKRTQRAYMYGDLAGDISPSRNVMTKIMDLGDDFEEVTEMHPIIELLQKANHVYNGFDLTVLRTLYQELTGNAYLHPIFDERLGVPTELWPMPSQHVEVIPSQDNFIDGYLYGQSGVESLVFQRDEVIHFKRPNPDNLFYGLGKVEAAYGTIQANEAMHEMDLATFHNHARPDYAVVVKGPVRRDDLDQFEQHVGERLRGTRKAGQFLTVSGDVSFQPLNFPPKDIGGREDIVEEIAAVFGVPVSMLKANDPNLASAKAGFGQWRESTILPMLRMDEDVLNQVLLPMFGIEDDAVLCYDNPVPADKEFELRKRQAAVAGGWLTVNEARLEQGLEQSSDPMADSLLMNGLPLGQAGLLGGLAGVGGQSPLDPPAARPEVERDAPKQLPDAQTPEVAASIALNGAQVTSLVEVLQNVSTGAIAKQTAIEVIVAMGIGRQEAERMLENQDTQVDSGDIEEAQDVLKSLPEPNEVEGELFRTPEEAAVRAEELGGEGFHVHETTQGPMYMPFFDMDDYTEATGIAHDTKAVGDIDMRPTEEMADLARRGLELRREHNRGGTQVGVQRASDISNRENLSAETIKRMVSFFARHRVDLDAPAANPDHEDYPSAGVIAWMLWGGDPSDPDGAGVSWANRKADQLDDEKNMADVAIKVLSAVRQGDISGLTAISLAKQYGISNNEFLRSILVESKANEKAPAAPSERITGSEANKPGTAGGSRGGITISKEQEKVLENKRDEHNEKHGDKKGKKVDLGMLKAVYRRGAGAFSQSHREGMTRARWAIARVNAFLHLVRTGKPKNSNYVQDNDLLPKGHPKRSD